MVNEFLNDFLKKGLTEFPRPEDRILIIDKTIVNSSVALYWSDKPNGKLYIRREIWARCLKQLELQKPEPKHPWETNINELLGVPIIIKDGEN